MSKRNINFLFLVVAVTAGITTLFAPPAFAATADISQVENFIRSIIQVIASLAGLIATGFFVLGGFGYITSTGNPEHMDKAKRTLLWSGIGLAIVIASFVLSNIIVELATNAFGS
jgi:hypothetical protein